MSFVITSEDPEGDEIMPMAVAATRDEARAWVLSQAKGYHKREPFQFTEGTNVEELNAILVVTDELVIWDWNPAYGVHDAGFCALGAGSGPFHYRITEVISA